MTHLLARGICIRDGKLLLAYHKEKRYYFLPGGHIEAGESGKTTLEREAQEEAGLSIKETEFALTFEHAWQGDTEMENEITLIYTFTTDEEDLRSHEPHLEFSWEAIGDLAAINFLPIALREPLAAFGSGIPLPPFISTLA